MLLRRSLDDEVCLRTGPTALAGHDSAGSCAVVHGFPVAKRVPQLHVEPAIHSQVPTCVKSHLRWPFIQAPLAQVWVETVSWFPRAFVLHDFLSAEECEHLITLGKPTMVKSSVIDNETGKSVDSR